MHKFYKNWKKALCILKAEGKMAARPDLTNEQKGRAEAGGVWRGGFAA